MSQTKIERLTPEQEASIPIYRQKWGEIAFSTKPINRELAANAVKAAYAAMGKPEPEIVFLSSPNAVREILAQHTVEQVAQKYGAPLLGSLPKELSDRLREQLEDSLWQRLQGELTNEELALWTFIWQDGLRGEAGDILPQLWFVWQEAMVRQMWEQQQAEWRDSLRQFPGGEPLTQIGDFLWQHIGEPLAQQLDETLWQPLAKQPFMQEWDREVRQPFLLLFGGVGFVANIGYNLLAMSVETIDFCISELDCQCDRVKWEAYKRLAETCGWTFMLEKACLVCDRPIELCFDSDRRFHAEGQPAIEFADGYQIYAFQGVRLPPRYGRIHPNLWQAEWLIAEQNAELRRVLIQGIGYSRICQELEAMELDWWREYTLLRIENEIDIEPIHLLKMTCPSTGYIHATRVPPNIHTAREAIRWVNWDVDPEEFSVET